MESAAEPRLTTQRGPIASQCQVHRVPALEVFGPSADGSFHAERSDYDLIARFAPEASQSLARRIVATSQALEALLGQPVDLMTDHPGHRLSAR